MYATNFEPFVDILSSPMLSSNRVSRDWIRSHREYMTLPAYVEISYIITDPDIMREYSFRSDHNAPWGRVDEIDLEKDVVFKRYITAEGGGWMFDSNTNALTTPYAGTGFVSSSVCDGMAVFNNPVIVTINFDHEITSAIPGLMINWSGMLGEMAREYSLVAYRNNALVARQRFINNTQVQTVNNFEVNRVNRIDIEIHEWSLPNKRARIEGIGIGFYLTLTNDNLNSMNHDNTADPLGSFLPENKLTFTLNNTNKDWNPVNPTGLFKFVHDKQEMVLRYGYEINGEIEWIDGGLFYVSGTSTPWSSPWAEFTSGNVFEFMLDMNYKGPATGTFWAIADAALRQADLPRLRNKRQRWFLDNKLRNYNADLRDDEGQLIEIQIKELLQLIAHASSCGLHQDRQGVIRIETITIGIDGVVQSDDHTSFSDLRRLANITPDDVFISGELGIWEYDKNFVPLSKDTVTSFVSNYISKSDGFFFNDEIIPWTNSLDAISSSFVYAPRLTLQMVDVQQNYASTVLIIWSRAYEEFARRFIVTAYYMNSVVERVRIDENTDVISVVYFGAILLDKITVDVLEWSLPHRRARIEHLSFAPDYIIDKFVGMPSSDIKSHKRIKSININKGLAIIPVSDKGIDIEVDNPLIKSATHARDVGNNLKRWLEKIVEVEADFRADPRLDLFNPVVVQHDFATNIAITEQINYSFRGGAFWGEFRGRIWS